MKKSINELKHILQKIVDETAVRVNLKNLLPNVISREGEDLIINDIRGSVCRIKLNYKKILIVGGGKVSHLLANHLDELFKDITVNGIVAIKSKCKKGKRVKYLRASHPKPDLSSLKAAEEIIDLLKKSDDETLVIFVITGGCSSLLTKPIEGISFYDKITTAEKLMKAGADISELNLFRRYFSEFKGGGIFSYFNSDSISLIISDVVKNDLETIASGITFQSKPDTSEVKSILMKYNLFEETPQSIRQKFEKNNLPANQQKFNHQNFIISDNILFQHLVGEIALLSNLNVHFIEEAVTGNVESASIKLINYYKKFLSDVPHQGKYLIISGGETVVEIKGNGKGGRNHELSLRMAKYISSFSNAVFLSLATDGDDGNSNHAGAIVTSETIDEINKIHVDIEQVFAENDSYSLFSKLNSEINFSQFITNVMDIQLFLIDFNQCLYAG